MSAALTSIVGALALALLIGAAAAAVGAALGAWLHRRATPPTAAARASGLLLCLMLPTLLVSASLGAAFLPSLGHALGQAPDNCLPGHDHHPHLCPLHPSDEPLRGAALVLGLGGAFGLSALVVRGVVGHLHSSRRRRSLPILPEAEVPPRHLRAVGEALGGATLPAIWVRSPLPVAALSGLWRPHLLLSPALVEALPPEELRAVLQHELAHHARGDLFRGSLARLGALLHLPGVGAVLLARYHDAVELACDADAARRVGSALPVASALVRLGRFGRGATLVGALSAAPSAVGLEARVLSLLDAKAPTPTPWITRLWAALWTALALILVMHPQVHHHLEDLLGLLSR